MALHVLSIFLLPCFLAAVVAVEVEFDPNPDTHWENFKHAYQKSYATPEEEAIRRKNFEESFAVISKHNAEYENGLHTFQMGLNPHSDMSDEEFSSKMKGLMVPDKLKGALTLSKAELSSDDSLPDSVDWRKKGAVSPVKNQGKCASCYAFSTLGAVESQQQIKHGNLPDLSEQQIVDCSRAFGDHGCNGGSLTYVYNYLVYNGGIETEDSYPYKEREEKCKYDKNQASGVKVTGYVKLPRYDEKALQTAVANIGPINTAINTGDDIFRHYKSGIVECSRQRPDHAILIVGYGTSDSGDYWLVKNSWGTDWGEDGYLKILKNGRNTCGIATIPSYPVVD